MEVTQTERLQLRKINPDDYEDLFILWHDRELIRYTHHVYMETPEDCRQRVLKVIEWYAKFDSITGPFIISSLDEFIGYCGFDSKSEVPKTIEIFYIFKKESHGLGYGSEVAKHLVNIAFNELGAEIVCAEVVKDNTASLKILEKTGMQLENYAENKFNNGVDSLDLLYYALSKDVWMKLIS